jgi:hypothetical protein
VAHERRERAVTAFRLVERRLKIGRALLEDRPEKLLVRDDACFDEVITKLLIPRPVKVIGQQVVAEHEFPGHTQDGEDDRGHPAAPVLPARTVVQRGQPAGKAQQPQRRAERFPLPWIADKTPVDLHHQRGRPPVAEFAPLKVVVTAGDDLVDDGQVPAGHRHGDRCQTARQPVRPGDQHLARRPEVDHRAQLKLRDRDQVGPGQ